MGVNHIKIRCNLRHFGAGKKLKRSMKKYAAFRVNSNNDRADRKCRRPNDESADERHESAVYSVRQAKLLVSNW